MSRSESPQNEAVYVTRSTGVLPAMKIKAVGDLVSYVRAMYEGGARVIEITTTTPCIFESFEILRGTSSRTGSSWPPEPRWMPPRRGLPSWPARG